MPKTLTLRHAGRAYRADLDQGKDLSLPLRPGPDTVNCFSAPPAEFNPLRAGDFVGSVAEGAPVNFFNVHFNPHGNGTHTECYGHISADGHSIQKAMRRSHFVARLLSVYPQRRENGDRVVEAAQLDLDEQPPEALILRTLPNDEGKKMRHYSGTNPPYLSAQAARSLADAEVEHLLIDLPSVDREEDGGQLLAHHAFWQYPRAPRRQATITELIFVDNEIKDGLYLLNLQTASFELDASPSKPVIFPLTPA